MSFDCSGWGWGAGEVLLVMMLASKIFVFKPFRIIAGLLNNVLYLVLHLLLFISSILDEMFVSIKTMCKIRVKYI